MIKKIGDQEYEVIKPWWDSRPRWKAIPRHVLPRDGFLVYLNDKPVLAGFLYLPSNGLIAWLTWLIADPDTTKEERQEALGELVSRAKLAANEVGAKIIFADSPMESLTHNLVINGFEKADDNITHLFYVNT